MSVAQAHCLLALRITVYRYTDPVTSTARMFISFIHAHYRQRQTRRTFARKKTYTRCYAAADPCMAAHYKQYAMTNKQYSNDYKQ